VTQRLPLPYGCYWSLVALLTAVAVQGRPALAMLLFVLLHLIYRRQSPH
jgi:hypothetical protein